MDNPEIILNELLANDAWIRSLAQRLVADDADADDVAQDAWVAALRNPPRRSGSVSVWIASVVRRIARSRQRAEGERRHREQSAGRPALEGDQEKEAVRYQVATAVFGLEEPYRSAIYYRYIESLPPREIAKRLDVTAAAVESRLRRGLEKLRARLDRDFGDRKTWCAALLPLTGLTAGEATAVTAATVGALIMGTKIKIAAVAVVAACVAVAFWQKRERIDSPPQAPISGQQREALAPERPKLGPVETTVTATKSAGPTAAPDEVASAAPGSSNPATESITGTVRDEAGRPVAGARLRLVHRDPSQDHWQRPVNWIEKITRTNGQGHYEFASLSRQLEKSIIDVHLHVSAKGYGGDRVKVSLGDRQDFVLLVGGRIEGRVIEEETRRPIPGAKVSILSRSLRGRTGVFGRSVDADANGRFVFEGVRPALYGAVGISPGRLTDYRRRIHIEVRPRCTTTLEIRLPVGLTVRGRVVDALGRPVAGAKIGGDGEAVTDADGRFEMSGVKSEAKVRIAADGKAPISPWVRFLHHESEAGVAEREFRLLDAAVLRGRIVGPDGAPVKGGKLRISDSKPPTKADDSGRFEVVIDTPGKTRRMGVSAPGFASTLIPNLKFAAGEVRDDLVIRLTRGGAIKGRVLTEKGNPIAGRTVMIRTWPVAMGRLAGVHRSTVSDADGGYQFEALASGTYDLTANGKNWPDKSCATRGRRRDARVEDGSVTHGIDLVPTARVTITGRVVDKKDRPLAGVRVNARAGPCRTWSDDDGRFELTGLPAGCPIKLDAMKPDYSYLREPTRFLPHPPAKQPEFILRMVRIPAGLRGSVVVAQTGAPATAFWIRAQSSVGKHPSTGMLRYRPNYSRTYFQDAGGAFYLSRSRSNRPCVIDAGTDSGLVSARPVAIGPGSDAEVVLPPIQLVPGGRVTGHVFTPDGTPIWRARVQATDPVDGRMLGNGWSFTHGDGVYNLTGLPPGPVLLHVKHDDWYPTSTTVRVQAGECAKQDHRLGEDGAVLQVSAQDTDGKPVAGATFKLFTPDGEFVSWWLKKYFALYRARFLQQGRRSFTDRDFRHELEQTAADGSVERRFLPPGRYIVEISRAGFETARQPVTVHLNAKNQVKVVLTRSD